MDHQHIQEHNVADRYLMEKLSVEERAQFEEHFVDCPDCMHLLETTETLRAGLRAVAAEQSTAYPTVGLLGWLAGLSGFRQVALAAAVALVMVLPTALTVIELRRSRSQLRETQSVSAELQSQNAENRQSIQSLEAKLTEAQQTLAGQAKLPEPQQFRSPAFASVFLLSSVRSADPIQSAAVNQVVISPSSQWVVLSPELDPDPLVQSYRATITTNGRTIWQEDKLALNPKGTVEPILSATLFKPGDYVLVIEGLTPNQRYVVAVRCPFRVIEK